MKWVGKKWACMGDSLTAENIRTTMHYHDYIAQKTGITVVNLGAGGTGYKREFNNVSGFMDRVDTIPLDSDVVTIFGSGNDNIYTVGDPSDTGTDTLCGCINTTISRIFERITTCQLGIVTPTPWQSFNPADDTNWMSEYSDAIVQICKNWGIPCLDLYHCSTLRPWDADFRAAAYSKDDGGGTHPDETGHALIAPRFEAFLNSLLLS
jgi:lysophospholipase L1-like esterase